MSNEYYVPDNNNDWQAMFLKTDGRLNRLRYLKRQLILLGISILLFILVMAICDNGYGFLTKRGELLITIINLCGFGVSYFLDVRRLHDLNKDNTIAGVILVAGIISNFDSLEGLTEIGGLVTTVGMLYLFFAPGTEGPNKYGPDPLGPTLTAEAGNAEQATNQNNASDIVDAVSNLTGNSQNNLVGNNGVGNLNNLPNPGVNPSNSSNTNVDAEDDGYESNDD
ncbi:MAG: DUF805 domain-containing protein, partial [Selenomonadaceae bacterium]|nr:DUF805 domain-containing protein [Selenomonadaceae bacterium]